MILRSEQILHILQRTTASAAPNSQNTQHQDTTAADENARNDDDSTQTRPQRVDADATNTHEDSGSTSRQQEDSDEQLPQSGRMIRLLAEDGSEFCMPRQVGALLAELIVKVRSLEELVLDQQRHAASSTHIADSRPGQNVHFANTYTIHGHDEWLGLQPTPPPAQRNGQADLPGVNPALVGGDRRSSAKGASWPNYSTPGTGNFSRSSMFHSRDIGQIVRKWQI